MSELDDLRAVVASLRNQRDRADARYVQARADHLEAIDANTAAEARVEALEAGLREADEFVRTAKHKFESITPDWPDSGAVNVWIHEAEVVRLHTRAALAAALPERQTAGPGCERHRGDPHNLCEACWAVEPPAALHNPQETNQ